MKKLIMKMLGLDNYIKAVNLTVEILRNQNEELKKKIEEINEKLEENETLSERDVESAIEEYLNNYDYATQDWVSGEIGDIDIEEKVSEAIDEIDIDEKVRSVVISELQKTHPVLMSEENIRKEISEAVKITLEKMVKSLADSQG